MPKTKAKLYLYVNLVKQVVCLLLLVIGCDEDFECGDVGTGTGDAAGVALDGTQVRQNRPEAIAMRPDVTLRCGRGARRACASSP